MFFRGRRFDPPRAGMIATTDRPAYLFAAATLSTVRVTLTPPSLPRESAADSASDEDPSEHVGGVIHRDYDGVPVMLSAVVVGCGRVGSLYDEGRQGLDPRSHAGAYVASQAIELAAGIDPDPGRRAAFERLWGVPTYSRVDEMPADLRPDVWSVCTPAGPRPAAIEAALSAGARAIWAEKPLALTSGEARSAVDRARQAGVPLAVNYLRRWDAAHIAVADAIRRGEVGRVEHVVAHYSDGLLNYGTHAIDLFRWFFGQPTWVWAHPSSAENAADPSPMVALGFTGGTVAALLPIRRDAHDTFEVDVVGAEARFTLRDRGAEVLVQRVVNDPDWRDERVLGRASVASSSGLRGMMLAALKNLTGSLLHGESLHCSGEDGVAALEIVEAARGSVAAGREQRL